MFKIQVQVHYLKTWKNAYIWDGAVFVQSYKGSNSLTLLSSFDGNDVSLKGNLRSFATFKIGFLALGSYGETRCKYDKCKLKLAF